MAAAHGGDEAGAKKVVVVSLTGASHSEHDTDIPGAERDSVRAGHEPDRFGVKSILAVPLLLTLVVLLAFGIVTAVFLALYTRFVPAPAGGSNPQAVQVNTVADKDGGRKDRDIGDRFARIGSTAPKDVDGLPGTAVPQPRLEYLKQRERETADDPAFERSKRPIESPSNTYEIRPEDLRPDNYVDPVTKERVLATYGWVDGKHTLARMPIEAAMKLVVDGKKLKARKDGIPSPATSQNTPTLSNGGVPPKANATSGNAGPTPPVIPKHDHKPDDHKH